MTPQEKAKELVNKFDLPSGLMSIERKQCALITVDEIMRFPKTLLYYIHVHRFREINEIDVYSWKDEDSIIVDKMTALEYWNKVKQEIEKL
jgi:hypothetical protein